MDLEFLCVALAAVGAFVVLAVVGEVIALGIETVWRR